MLSITQLSNSSYETLLSNLQSNKNNSNASLALKLLGGSSAQDDKIQSIDLSEYYEKLNTLGIQTDSSSSDSSSTEDSIESTLINALNEGSLSVNDVNKISSAMLAYETNTNIINSTFSLDI